MKKKGQDKYAEEEKERPHGWSEEQKKYYAKLLTLLDRHNEESSLGMVLVTSSFIDEQLKEILGSFFTKEKYAKELLDGANAPLGTLSSRINAAAALGLISDEECKNCHLVRKIRNDFAHKVTTSFDDDNIKELCRNLTGDAPGMLEPKGKYSTAVMTLVIAFYNRAHYVGKARLKYHSWPY